MIKEIAIKNFKSIVDLKLPLGRFNLFIGANGSGKSNILEAIAFGAAASSDKLDFEYFANRGIRVVEPRFMLPAFEDAKEEKIIISVLNGLGKLYNFDIQYNRNRKPSYWENANANIEENDYKIIPSFPELNQFLIYSLEESKLRKADDSNRTFPLGLHGEGLFAYLKALVQRSDSVEIFNEIKENLKVLDWFDDMNLPTEQLSNEFNIQLKDSYLSETINTFDQRSTNEGFLYLLFYLTLIVSDETPPFFAIENIDTAFNPKLCREVTRRLIELARKHDKQIIATTHNASVLDGLNLKEEDVCLDVVRRNVDGYTKVSQVKLKNELGMPLSEAWQKGFIGGLPDNF